MQNTLNKPKHINIKKLCMAKPTIAKSKDKLRNVKKYVQLTYELNIQRAVTKKKNKQ